MDFDQAQVGIEILGRYTCGQNRDYGDKENRKIPLTGNFDFGHDVCWISLYRTTSNPAITTEERQKLEDAGWFFDDEQGAWSHF